MKWGIRGLILLGLIQTVAYLFNLNKLKGLASVTVASPLALVFSNFRGIDTYALDFKVSLNSKSQGIIEREITPSLYSKLEGPYNLRNVYGAVFSYGAKFQTEKELAVLNAVLDYGLCSPGQLVKDFGLSNDIQNGEVFIQSKKSKETWKLGFQCKD